MRYFGSAATAPPVAPEVFEVTAAPQGAWPTLGGAPFYYNGYSYIGFANDAGGIRVAIFDHATGTVTQSQIAADGSTSVDQHNKPALIRVASDDRLLTVFCDHASANIWVRESVNTLTADPTLTGGWGTATNIDSQVGGIAYTYPALFQLTSETDDPIVLFFRTQDGSGNNWCVSRHLDDGSSWATGWTTLTNITFGTRYYGLACQTGAGRLDFAFTDGSYAEDFASLYHVYYEAGDYFTSDGVSVAGSAPYTITDFTLVYDGSTAGVRAPADILNDGTDIAIVFPVQTGTPSGHIGEDEDYLYCRAAVGSATWSNENVALDVGALTFEFTEGSLAIDTADIDHLIVSRRASSSIGLPFHLYDYLTTDDGATWAESNVSVSGDADMYPWFVRGYQPELEYVWLKGTFVTQSNFDTGIQGFGTTP
jgi:hypothetical protein